MTVIDGGLRVLLLDRTEDDFKGWAMPGGFVHIEEALEDSVKRVLAQKVGLENVHFEQLATYGALSRDPRGRVISIVYLALCPAVALKDFDLAHVIIDWEGEVGGPATAQMNNTSLPMAFDHAESWGMSSRDCAANWIIHPSVMPFCRPVSPCAMRKRSMKPFWASP